MKGIVRTAAAVSTLAVIVSLMACAPGVQKAEVDLVWPLPPDEPRIRYIEMFRSNEDVEPQSGIAQAIFGEENIISLRKPYGVAVDKEGRIYVTDIGRVLIFDKKNKKLRQVGQGAGLGQLRIPIGITVDGGGRIFVTDTAADRVYIYNKDGRYLNAIGRAGEFASPSGVVVDDKRGRIYVVDAKKHNIRAYSFDGKDLLMTIGEPGTGDGQLHIPSNIALDSRGNIYVADTGNFRLQIFSPEGKFIRAIGKVGDQVGSFTRPKGVALDSEDHIYVVDAAFQNVQVFDTEGRPLLFFGEGGIQPGQFGAPAGIAIGDDDRIYVVDQLNSRVQVFQYLGSGPQKGRTSVKPQ